MVIRPSWFASPAVQAATFALPSAMSAIVRSSSTVTESSALQLPMHEMAIGVVGVGLGVEIAVAVGV